MNRELDILEKTLIKGISQCSIFNVIQVKNVYLKTGSFDDTIAVLKMSVSRGTGILEAYMNLKNQNNGASSN